MEQTPPGEALSGPDATRIDASVEQCTWLVTAQDLSPLRYLMADGGYRHQTLVTGVCALGWHQRGKGRAGATLRSRSPGPTRPGRGRHKTDDGKGHWSDVSRFARLETEEEDTVFYPQVLHNVQWKLNIKVVVVVPTRANREVVLLRTDGTLEARRLYRSSKARFHMELLFRDSKQLTGVLDGQARAKAKLHFHVPASLTAASFATLAGPQHDPDGHHAFSMASLQRRACNQHLLDRICAH